MNCFNKDNFLKTILMLAINKSSGFFLEIQFNARKNRPTSCLATGYFKRAAQQCADNGQPPAVGSVAK